MTYTYNRTLTGVDIDAADTRIRAALKDNGFGILTEIDVKATMKKKIDVGIEPRVGAMLPCNVILRAVDGGTEISAIDPVASMQAIDNDELHSVAGEVRDMMRTAVDAA